MEIVIGGGDIEVRKVVMFPWDLVAKTKREWVLASLGNEKRRWRRVCATAIQASSMRLERVAAKQVSARVAFWSFEVVTVAMVAGEIPRVSIPDSQLARAW